LKMKTMYSLALMVSAVVLLLTSVPVHASTMDDSIESSAKKSYVFKTYLQGDDIKIQSKDGVVSLTGTVSEESHKALAKRPWPACLGEKRGQQAGTQRRSPDVNSDAWIRDKVKATLSLHPSVSAGNTEVDFKDGIVTLSGNAPARLKRI